MGGYGARFLHTPPFALVLTALTTDMAPLLAGALADRNRPLSQVAGDSATIDAFLDEWRRRHPGTTTSVAMRQRLYRLGEIVDPATPGSARLAEPVERDLLIDWMTAFHRDIGNFVHADAARGIDQLLSYGGLTLWTVDDTPVSMASLTRPAGGMVRVGSVYTPPDLRRRGYAGAVVATVSRAARAAGTPEIVLFTDLENPTSNSVYHRIGFQAVEDSFLIDLQPPRTRRRP
jgi:predicted GNAT family acetyltransferase